MVLFVLDVDRSQCNHGLKFTSDYFSLQDERTVLWNMATAVGIKHEPRQLTDWTVNVEFDHESTTVQSTSC